MRCNNCGYENLEGYNVCPKCNSPIANVQSYNKTVVKKRGNNQTFIILLVLGTIIVIASIFLLIYDAKKNKKPQNITPPAVESSPESSVGVGPAA